MKPEDVQAAPSAKMTSMDEKPWESPLKRALEGQTICAVRAVQHEGSLVELILEMKSGHTLTLAAIDDEAHGQAVRWELLYPQPIQIGRFDWAYPQPLHLGIRL